MKEMIGILDKLLGNVFACFIFEYKGNCFNSINLKGWD